MPKNEATPNATTGPRNTGASKPRRILVAVDFSEYSDRALDVALALAGPLGAEVHALHVCVLLAHALVEGAHPEAPDFEARVKAEIDAGLARMRASAETRGQALAVHRVDGHPADRIVAEADRLGADLVALGTHGRSGLDRLLLGSVAERVVRTAKVPVLTVH